MESQNFWRSQHTDAVDSPNFLQESPADTELQSTAASDRRVPETRPGRVPRTHRIGVATAPQDMQQRLKHDGSLAATWLGQQTYEICETLQRCREPDANLSHIGQCFEFQRRPMVSADPSFVAQQRDRAGRTPVRSWRASMLSLRGFGTTRVEGLRPARYLGLVVLPDPVPLICPQLHRGVGVEQRLAVAAILSSMAGVLTVSEPFGKACTAFLDPITASRAHFLTLELTRARSRDASTFMREPASSTMPVMTSLPTTEIVVQNPGRRRGSWAARPLISSRSQQTYGIDHNCICHVTCNASPPAICPAQTPRTSDPALLMQTRRLS